MRIRVLLSIGFILAGLASVTSAADGTAKPTLQSTSKLLQSSDGEPVVEKILTAKMSDGIALAVHYTDKTFKKIEDQGYPSKVLRLTKKAYETLTEDMGFDGIRSANFRRIDLYLVDAEEAEELPMGGFGQEDFRRAPLFLIQQEAAGAKSPAILLPMNYPKFIELWDKVNRVPFRKERDLDKDLAGSIMHEMTHAVLHVYHENLGSTEYRIRNGDWYTEGLARYYELKIGSDSGFASQGFRRKLSDKIQFSRGGANYYLRFPDQSFFGLRYENALFWLYFEKKFGTVKIIELTRRFNEIPFDAGPAQYIQLLEHVTSLDFRELLDSFFNWIYRGDHLSFPECANLLEAARTRSVWSDGELHLISQKGADVRVHGPLAVDWVAQWGEDAAGSMTEKIAGDWTDKADVEPLSFDIHEIWTSGAAKPQKLVIRNKGPSRNLRVSVYLYVADGIRTLNGQPLPGRQVEFRGFPKSLTKFGIVLSNLDSKRKAEYEIELR